MRGRDRRAADRQQATRLRLPARLVPAYRSGVLAIPRRDPAKEGACEALRARTAGVSEAIG